MENIALIESFSEFKDDKLIDRVTLMAILEDVFRNALKKKYGSDDNFDIIINPDKGDMEIWQRRIVVADDDLDLEHLEITLTDARKIEPDFEIGEEDMSILYTMPQTGWSGEHPDRQPLVDLGW